MYGDFTFDEAPGEFDSDVGWEAGFGVDFLKSRFKIGFDFLYRDISFDYNSPGIAGVSANESSLDASGFSISGTVSYYF